MQVNPKTTRTAIILLCMVAIATGLYYWLQDHNQTGRLFPAKSVDGRLLSDHRYNRPLVDTAYIDKNGYAKNSIRSNQRISTKMDEAERKDLVTWHTARLDSIADYQFKINRQLVGYTDKQVNRFLTLAEKDTISKLRILFDSLEKEKIAHEQQLTELKK